MSKYNIKLNREAKDPLNIMLDVITPGATVLEFGCANGRMTQYMKEKMGCKVYIVEYNQADYAIAQNFAEDGICGDIMLLEWKTAFRNLQFDYIIFADVLEHLNEPDVVLKNAVDLLCENGMVLISVPNIAHNDILLNLYEGHFHYTELGLLDNTHIHFFTYEHLEEICKTAGLNIVYKDCTCVQTNCTEQRMIQEVKDNDLLELLYDKVEGEVYQHIVGAVLTKSSMDQKEKLINKVPERLGYVERNIFFDIGDNFENGIVKKRFVPRSDGILTEKYEVPDKAIRIRFDPIEKLPCVVTNLRIYTDKEQILSFETNAEHLESSYYFRNYDAQIVVTLGEAAKWIVFEGEISYSYDIMPIGDVKLRNLRREVEKKDCSLDLLKNELMKKEDEIENLNCLYRRRLKQEELHNIYIGNVIERKNDAISMANEKLRETEEIVKRQKDELEQLKNTCEMYFQNCEALKSSTSWKITAPLRRVVDCIKGIKAEPMEQEGDSAKTGELGCRENILQGRKIQSDMLWDFDIEQEFEVLPMVSVIVPNYNHAIYLRERLESIYNQTYSNFEVILLDDCSSDDSRMILDEYAEAYAEKTIKVYNTENCGKVFRQWDKGIALAKGQLIWIAESDDYCESNFLEEMVNLFRNESVMLAFSRSVFMQDGIQVWSTEEYLHDLSQLCWNEPFTMTAHNLVKMGFGIKNIIPNVSSAVFKNVGKFSEEKEPLWEKMKLCGDWLFYLNLIKGGCVSYTNHTTNYYRVHQQSTSLNVQRTGRYYEEQYEVSKYVARNYDVDISIFEVVLRNLKEHYKAINQTEDAEVVATYYSVKGIEAEIQKRQPNVLMCLYSMDLGGGETYALHLANEMKKQSIAVTLLNFNMGQHLKSVKKLLDLNVPYISIKSLDDLYHIIVQLGGEIVHSHHASVDGALSDWLADTPLKCKQVITLHGMYETLAVYEREQILNKVMRTCGKFIYIADKNLQPFVEYECYQKDKFDKLPNGLAEIPITPVKRKTLNIGENDFVLCLASRGIPEKGWQEAINAVIMANKKPGKKIQLVILGDGEVKDSLEKTAPEFVHFTGMVSNVRDYFAMSDLGILPSRFRGESYPLVIIECFMAGKPMIATDIGEVKNQLKDENGELAGEILDLENWQIDVSKLAEKIYDIANCPEKYRQLCERVNSARKKFDISEIVKKYRDIYYSVWRSN